MPIFENNRSLLDGFRRGASDALHRVYAFYLKEVVRLVRYGFVSGAARVRGIKERGGQMDAAHDIFTKAFLPKARLSYDGLRPYRPFLMRIGKNLLIDRLRKRGEEVSIDDVDIGGETLPSPEEDGSGEEKLHFERLRKATTEFLQGCDEELQTFVRLRFEEDCSQNDVANQMSLTRRRIRTLERRAQDGLKDFLKKRKML